MKKLICALAMCGVTTKAGPNDPIQNRKDTNLLACIPSGCPDRNLYCSLAVYTKYMVCHLKPKPMKSEIDGENIIWYPVPEISRDNLNTQSIKIPGMASNPVSVAIATDDPIYDQLIQQCHNLLCSVCTSNVSFRQASGKRNVFWLNNNCERMQCTVNLTPEGCEITLTGVMQKLLSIGTLKIEVDSELVNSYFEDVYEIIDTEGRGIYESCLYHLRTILGNEAVSFHKDAFDGIYRHVLGLTQLFTLNDLISSLEQPGLQSKIDQFMRAVQANIRREGLIILNPERYKKQADKSVPPNSQLSCSQSGSPGSSSSSSSSGQHGSINNVSHTLSQAIFYVGQNAIQVPMIVIQVPMINNFSIEIETLSEVSHLIEANFVKDLSAYQPIIIPAINIKISFNAKDETVECNINQASFRSGEININALIMAASKWVLGCNGSSKRKICFNEEVNDQQTSGDTPISYLAQNFMWTYGSFIKAWPNVYKLFSLND